MYVSVLTIVSACKVNLLFGWAQTCFPVLTGVPCLKCLPEGPNSYVLAIAPRVLCVCLISPNLYCAF